MEAGTKILAASLSIAVVLGSSSRAAAYCNVPQPRLICAEYFASQVVVEATLTQARVIHDKDDPGHLICCSLDIVDYSTSLHAASCAIPRKLRMPCNTVFGPPR